MTLAEVQVKWSVTLIDGLGPDNFWTLQMKRHVLHRARAHFKVPGCSLIFKAPLTKKLPMFLSRLNEINGGCEKNLPVLGSFWSNLKFLRMMDFTAWLWGWNVGVNGVNGEWMKRMKSEWSFQVAAPKLWNALLHEIRSISHINTFECHLKILLFRNAFSFSESLFTFLLNHV